MPVAYYCVELGSVLIVDASGFYHFDIYYWTESDYLHIPIFASSIRMPRTRTVEISEEEYIVLKRL